MEVSVSKSVVQQYALKSKLPTIMKAEVRLGDVKLTPRVKNAVVNALETGYLPSMSGASADLYELLLNAYDLPGVLVRKGRKTRYCSATFTLQVYGQGMTNNADLENYIKADHMAARMVDGAENPRWRSNQGSIQWYARHGCGYVTLEQLLDDAQLKEAVSTRYSAGDKDRAEQAKQALLNGITITLTHD